MPAYIIALNIKSRYRRPDVGAFIFMDAYERHVWKQTVASDVDTLARLMNEALAFMRAWDQLDMHIEIVAVQATEAPLDAATEQRDLLVPELGVKKRRMLQPTLPD
jgi:hypothetical protein